MCLMFEKLVARLKRRQPLSQEELAEQESIRREAEAERRRAEAGMAEQRGEITRGGGSMGSGWGGL